MISSVDDAYKAMDNIEEEEVINVVENHLKVPNPVAEFQMRNSGFSVGTMQKSTTGSKSTKQGKRTSCDLRKDTSTKPQATAQGSWFNTTSMDKETPKKDNTPYDPPSGSKVIQDSVYLSPTNESDVNPAIFSTPPETETEIPLTVTCTKVKSEQRQREKYEKALQIIMGKQQNNPYVSFDEESTFSHTSKAMKLMTLSEPQDDTKSSA